MKYFARVIRPRFELAFIEVEAKDEEEAATRAMCEAIDGSPRWKLMPFDEDDYEPWVEGFVDEAGGGTYDGSTYKEAKAWLRSVPRYQKYAFLQADVESGEGELIHQPWLPPQGELMLDDLGGDWVAGIYRMVFGEDPPPFPEGAKVLPFPKRRPSDDEEPPPAA